MTLLAICESIRNTPFSTALRESTWGFPILGATHVLAMAWLGGMLVIRDEIAAQLRPWKWIGLALLLGTGALLFWVEPVKCYQSLSFRLKLLLLILLAVTPKTRLGAGLPLLLWIAVVFAARGIAFF